VYCHDCRWNYYVCTRTFLAKYSAELPKVCKTCEKINEEGLLESQNELKGKMNDGIAQESNPDSKKSKK
jgi:hypothetical protein